MVSKGLTPDVQALGVFAGVEQGQADNPRETLGNHGARRDFHTRAQLPPRAGHCKGKGPAASRRDGPVAQWLEPTAHNGLVAGSSPAGPTNALFGI